MAAGRRRGSLPEAAPLRPAHVLAQPRHHAADGSGPAPGTGEAHRHLIRTGAAAMRIMLDCSPAKLAEYRARYDFDFYQLRTPLTKYARAVGVPYGLDNGCFSDFPRRIWERLLNEAEADRPLFCTLPDVVGDAQRTAELFDMFAPRLNELP